MKTHNNHCCLIWKSNGISFDKTIKELEVSFKVVDSVLSDKHDESFIKCESKPKKFQSQLTNMIVFGLKTFSTDKAVPYANCIYR